MQNRVRRSKLELRCAVPGASWPKLPRCALRAVVRAVSESDDERGCFAGGEGVPRGSEGAPGGLRGGSE
eukprot:5657434-Alexandrium_andersonii.AAC.1